MKTNTQIQHDCALCSGFSPQPHVWPRVFFLLLPPCWIWAPAENLWELRLVSCPRRSFLLPRVPCTAGRLPLRLPNTCSSPLCFTTFSKGDATRISASRCTRISADLHISWLASMWASTGVSKSFQSQSTLTITLPKGSLSSRGEDPVSNRHSTSSPGCGIERMVHLSVTRPPKSSIWPLCSFALLTSAEISLSLRPLWLPCWFRVSRLLFLPAPSQLSFRCSLNFCCVPLWLLICTASVTIAKQNMNMSVSSLILSTIYTLTACGVRSKIPGMDSAPRTSCPRPHTIPWVLQSRLADGRRWSKTKQKISFRSRKWGRTLLFIKVKLFEVFRTKQISQI